MTFIDSIQAEIPSYATDGTLTINNRHGLRIVFVQTGLIGAFSFITLLVNLVSGVVLIKVATTIVDLVAIRLLPQRSYYKQYKYEETVDFSDLREGKVQVGENSYLLKQ